MIRTPAHAHRALRSRAWAHWLLLALLLPLIAACGSSSAATAPTAAPAAPTAAGKTIKAVTTMSILADMVKHVGGDRVEAENIIPIGAGPEDYQPTPLDAQKIAGADIVFYNGHGLEEWLDDLFKSAAYGAKYVEKIRDGLIQADPAGKDTYTTNADAYIKQLIDLNAELKQQADALPAAERKMVTNHDAFPYFAKEYGFTIVGNILGNPEAELSAGDLAKLTTAIKEQKVKAIFSESQFNPKVAKALADEAGVQVVADLYTNTLGDTSSGATSYVDMLRYDMKTIVEALKLTLERYAMLHDACAFPRKHRASSK